MLNRQKFVETLDKACESLGFDKRKVLISHGGASLFHGLRKETADIDATVPKEYWDLLLENGCKITTLPQREHLPPIENIIYMGVDFHLGRENVDDRDKMIFHGYAVTKPLRLLRDRIKLGREKDVSDIYALQKHSRFLTSCEQSEMWTICRRYRGTATY